MPAKKSRKSVRGLFSAIGGGIFNLGGSVQRLPSSVKKSRTQIDRQKEVSKRLRDIKELAVLSEETLTEKKKEEKWDEETVKIKRHSSERLSDIFFAIFKRPAQKLARFFKGMDADLYRANIRSTPERYAAKMIGISAIVTTFAISLMVFLNIELIFLILGGGLSFFFSIFFTRTQPKRRAKTRVAEVNRLLPYALRHMGTQLTSGIGLPETMTSVSRASYGALSEEFDRLIRDMNAGAGFEEALASMDKRVNSEPLRRATRQIQRALRTGGDLAKTLNTLADETAFEMRMKLRDYTQSLNMFTLIYMFVSSVIPAMLMITINISSSGSGGGVISPTAAGVIYLLLLPFLLFYFIMMIKRFEPRL